MGPELVSRHPEVASRQWRSMFLKYLRSFLLNLGAEPSRVTFPRGWTVVPGVFCTILDDITCQPNPILEGHPAADAGFLCGFWFPQLQKLLQSVWSKHLRTPLHYACAYGNPAVVALLVKRKCSIDLCDSDGNTPLMKALQYEEEECAIILLEHGANPNVHNNKGETPLHYVIFYRNTLIATKLLSSNADIEAKNTSGQTPLLLAIKKNRQMMVEFFIKNKANIHAVDDNGRTALMLAVEHKSTQIAELLLQCGVNVSASDNCGEIALSYAIASGNTANRNLILQYMKAQSRTSVNFNPEDTKSAYKEPEHKKTFLVFGKNQLKGIHINFRYTLKEDEVKRKNDDMLHEKNKNPLKEKEAEYNKEDQVRKQAEISVCTIDTELETARNHFNQVSPSDGTENKLLHNYHKKKDEVSMKRLGMDTVKYQNQEKKCFENTEILREKNTSLPWTQKLNEETLMEIFQDNEQLGIWKVESTLQNFTPESEKQSTERPETDVKSHPARSGPAPPHQGESPTPKRNLELAFQRGRDKDFSSQEKKNIDVSNLNINSEIPSQQVPKSEVKTSDLENELHQSRVMTLDTDQVNRHLKQRQYQLKEMEYRYQNEQRKRNEHLRKQEASKEKVSKLQRETTLHEDQLHDYQNKGENKINGLIIVQTQFYDVIKKLQARNDRCRLMLENKYLELINETNHLKDQLDQYGKEKAEEVSIKQDICIKSLQRNTQSDICLWLNVDS
ncbi:ankyrin repeat domain-containing protein 26-like [Marmota marmota marmota]|uniref:ankyrin repeat domain-containing protein 26-like n=1 Tax=Marmota marmota marmota TaxID=9994 RepID=UPI002091FAE2|nr:ankyrin repeat domain-containing protein 26-like [Marmota marmota marmota]